MTNKPKMPRKMTEWEKAFKKDRSKIVYKECPFCSDLYHGYKAGFQEALKPQHTKLTPEVKALIKGIELMIARAGNPDPKEACRLVIETGKYVLKPFEKEWE